MSRSDVCPACETPGLESFYEAEDIPTNSCLLLEDPDEARDFPVGDLELGFCTACGFITNMVFDPRLAEYSERYEETQGYSPTFVDFGRSLAKDWVEKYDLHGKHVLEIGCGKGEFLTWMVEAGVASGLGIDPGVHPERFDDDAAERIEWIADFYDERYAHLQADAIVCRHTLEHISPVGDFLATLRENIGDQTDTVVLFELPDALRVLREKAFWDVYYEHCSYFTLDSLGRLFGRCGFDVLSSAYKYDGQYLIVEAKPAVAETGRFSSSDQHRDAVGALATRFGAEVQTVIAGWQDRIDEVTSAGGSVALWGGGSKAVAFLTSLRDPSQVDLVVDINPHKQGRFIAGTGHAVADPGSLPMLGPDLVVAMNSVYVPEIQENLDDLGVAARLDAL